MINVSKIKAAREKRGVSQESMAERLHISQSAYARMESGKQKIEAGQLFKIANELEIPVSELFEAGSSFQFFNHSIDNNSSFIQNFHTVQKELYDEHLKLLREEIAELRSERKELLGLLKSRMP